MHNISKMVAENRAEAYGLVKQKGGKIEFVDDNNPTPNCPSVVGGFDSIADLVILAVKCSEDMKEPNLEFLAYDCEECECIGWIDDASCVNNTENAVYEYIYDYIRHTE